MNDVRTSDTPCRPAAAIYWQHAAKGDHFAISQVAAELGISSGAARRRLFARVA